MYNAQETQNRAAHARYLLTQQRTNLRILAEECQQLLPLSQLAQLYGSLVPDDDDDDDDDDDEDDDEDDDDEDDDDIQPLSAEEC